MFHSNLVVIVSLLLTSIPGRQGQQQQQCSVDSLPVFDDHGERLSKGSVRPDFDMIQAIVPTYTFQCSGRVTEWRACVEPGDNENEQYYIQFQVWRPTNINECYELVGYNIPLDDAREEERDISDSDIIIEAEGFLSPRKVDSDDPLHRCVVLPVRESQQIEFQSGDVIGYYVDYYKKRDNMVKGGIQWIEGIIDADVFYRYAIQRDDLKSQYAIGERTPNECGFQVLGDNISSSLSSSMNRAPVISLSIAVVSSTPTLKPTMTDTPPPSTDGSGSTSVDIAITVTVALFVLAIAMIISCTVIVVFVKRSRIRKLNSFSDYCVPEPQTKRECNLQCIPTVIPAACSRALPASEGRTSIQPEGSTTNGENTNHHMYSNNSAGVGYYDYTVSYEDPTSPLYVCEVYSSGSVFDSIGTYVPTMVERSNYAVAESTIDTHKYNNLQFFERDQVFWAPASTTSGLYEQLCTKRYREISRSQIRSIQEELGSGQFGTVSKVVWMYQNESMEVAVKVLKSGAMEMNRVKFLQEAAIMGQFYHPNIVQLHGVVTVGDPILIVLDFMANGDMKRYLDHLVVRSEDQVCLPSQFLKYGREIAAGMAYLAKKSFVHRDLAARNILLDDRMSCKIGDFGMARDLVDDTYYKSHGGQIPVKWTAPEGLLYKKFSTASDVWSYAMVLYEIWSVGNKPFEGLCNNDMVLRLQNPQCLAPPPGCPRQVYTLMVDCWNPDPQLRPTFEAVFRTLRRPEELLLHWSEEDVAAGRHLLRATHTTHSFSDLQNKYTAQ